MSKALTYGEQMALLRVYVALGQLTAALKQATEAATTMHNIKSLLAEHGVKVPR